MSARYIRQWLDHIRRENDVGETVVPFVYIREKYTKMGM